MATSPNLFKAVGKVNNILSSEKRLNHTTVDAATKENKTKVCTVVDKPSSTTLDVLEALDTIEPTSEGPVPGNHSANPSIDPNDHLSTNLEGLRKQLQGLQNETAFLKEEKEFEKDSSRVPSYRKKWKGAPMKIPARDYTLPQAVRGSPQEEEYLQPVCYNPNTATESSYQSAQSGTNHWVWNRCSSPSTWVNSAQQNTDDLAERVTVLESDFHHCYGPPSDTLLRIASQTWHWCLTEREDIEKMIGDGYFTLENGTEDEKSRYAGDTLGKLLRARGDLIELLGRLDVLLDITDFTNVEIGESSAASMKNSDTGDTTPSWLGQDGYEDLTEQWFENHARRLFMERSLEQPPEIARLLNPQVKIVDEKNHESLYSGQLGFLKNLDQDPIATQHSPSLEDAARKLASMAIDAIQYYLVKLDPEALVDCDIVEAAWAIIHHKELSERGPSISCTLLRAAEEEDFSQAVANNLRLYLNTISQTDLNIDEYILKQVTSLLMKNESRTMKDTQEFSQSEVQQPKIPPLERRWSKCNCGQERHAVSCPDYPLITDEVEVDICDPKVMEEHDKDEALRKKWEDFHEGYVYPAETLLLDALKKGMEEWKPTRPVDKEALVAAARKIISLAKGKGARYKGRPWNEVGPGILVPDDAEERLKDVVKAMESYFELVWKFTDPGVEVSEKVLKATRKVIQLAERQELLGT